MADKAILIRIPEFIIVLYIIKASQKVESKRK